MVVGSHVNAALGSVEATPPTDYQRLLHLQSKSRDPPCDTVTSMQSMRMTCTGACLRVLDVGCDTNCDHWHQFQRRRVLCAILARPLSGACYCAQIRGTRCS